MMKTQINAFNKYFSILAKRLGVLADWQRVFKTQSSAIGYLNRIPIVLLGKSGRTWVLAIVSFGRTVRTLHRQQGFKGVAIYLKVAHTVLIKTVAGSPIDGVASSLGHRVKVTRSGYPSMIPKAHRMAIKRGDYRVVRFWSTLFSFYRVLPYPAKPKLSTITKPGLSIDLSFYSSFVEEFFMMWNIRKGSIKVKVWEGKIIEKSGPGVTPSSIVEKGKYRHKFIYYNTTAALIVQALALVRSPSLMAAFKKIASVTNQNSLVSQFNDIARWGGYSVDSASPVIPEFLGKLGVKAEPGKMRVFAMVDWWTQTLLRPIHTALFEILSKFPNDATMDQDKAIRLGTALLRKKRFAASYDLSAATDRLPVSLQQLLVEYLWPRMGEAWKELLVGREYSVPKSVRGLGMKIPKSVTYAVGQPMGALSSWAMLALTHHFIVQFAAKQVGWGRWFPYYLVLGDDIVIFDRRVASQYLIIMASLGVEINLVKSVVSETSFEFAKRFVHLEGKNLSPVSVKEMDVASKHLDALLLLFQKFRPDFSLSELLSFSGAGYRVLGKLDAPFKEQGRYWSSLLQFALNPLSPYKGKITQWLPWYSLDSIKTNRPLNLISMKDKMLLYIKSSLPERLVHNKKMISGPEMGAGLRPDEEGVFRFNTLFNQIVNPSLKRELLGHEEKLLLCANRLLYKATLNTDLSKIEINAEWKDIQQFWEWKTQSEAEETMGRTMMFLSNIAAKEVDPKIDGFKPEPLPRSLAPKLLRLRRRLV